MHDGEHEVLTIFIVVCTVLMILMLLNMTGATPCYVSNSVESIKSEGFAEVPLHIT